jgi:hypothetical protein
MVARSKAPLHTTHRRVRKPRRTYRGATPLLTDGWEPFGIPSVVLTDNGREFHSLSIAAACAALGIRHVVPPPKAPAVTAKRPRRNSDAQTRT